MRVLIVVLSLISCELFQITVLGNIYCNNLGKCEALDNGTLFQCQNIIPKNLPHGIVGVVLECFQGHNGSIVISKQNFTGLGWESIVQLAILNPSSVFTETGLILENNSFAALRNLEDLTIHMTDGQFNSGVFHGLDYVKKLDLTNCTTMTARELTGSLNQHVLPRLQSLVLQKTGKQSGGMSLDEAMMGFVGSRPVTYLDISYAEIPVFNFSVIYENCDKFETVVMNDLVAARVVNATPHVCKNLKTIDISRVRMPQSRICAGIPFVIQNIHGFNLPFDYLAILAHAENITANSLCTSSFTVKNVTEFRFQTNFYWSVRHLSIDGNFLKYGDFEIVCENPTIESISIRRNSMEFLSPKAFTCVHTLKHVDLSENKLHVMQTENESLFTGLFQFLPNLNGVALSDNRLIDISPKMFENKTRLEIIDLSRNTIGQVHFISHLKRKLSLLNISSNNIQILDNKSLAALDRLKSLYIRSNRSLPWLDIGSNPISCSVCTDSKHVEWILTNRHILFQSDQITCIDEDGKTQHITTKIKEHLEYLCTQAIRKRNIILASSISGTAIIVLIVTLYVGKKLQKKFSRRKRLKVLMQNVEGGRDEFEFLVFLAYNTADDQFANSYVVDDLLLCLQALTKCNRNLVCIGDSQFRLGRPLHDEIVNSLKRSSMVIVILSDNFLLSDFCLLEFSQALHMGKPVILMLKECVNEALMPEAMTELFKRQTRLIWTKVGDEYVLKTSWKNIGESIIDLVLDRI